MSVKKYYDLRKKVLEKLYFHMDIDFISIDNNFVKEVEDYFLKADTDEEIVQKLRRKKNLDPELSEILIRTIDRIEVRKKIIQTLLSIVLGDVPDIRDPFLFKQLYDITEELFNLFFEKDIYEGSLRDYINSDFLSDYIYNFKDYYKFSVDEIKEKLLYAKKNKDFVSIFEALFLISIFWFTIREGDINKIRKSDIYIYLLSKKLIEKYRKL